MKKNCCYSRVNKTWNQQQQPRIVNIFEYEYEFGPLRALTEIYRNSPRAIKSVSWRSWLQSRESMKLSLVAAALDHHRCLHHQAVDTRHNRLVWWQVTNVPSDLHAPLESNIFINWSNWTSSVIFVFTLLSLRQWLDICRILIDYSNIKHQMGNIDFFVSTENGVADVLNAEYLVMLRQAANIDRTLRWARRWF